MGNHISGTLVLEIYYLEAWDAVRKDGRKERVQINKIHKCCCMKLICQENREVTSLGNLLSQTGV